MRVRWPSSWSFLRRAFSGRSSNARNDADLQAVPEFLFEEGSLGQTCEDRTPGRQLQPGFRLVGAGQAPYRRIRQEELAFSRSEIPALTIAANASQAITITGQDRGDWSLHFCAYGDGNSENEALDRLRDVSLVRLGGAVSLNGPRGVRAAGAGGNVMVQAPVDAPVTVHASFAPVVYGT